MPEIDSPLGKLAYLDSGLPDAPALVLLHPIGFDSWAFDPLATLLEPAFRVLRLDLPGHGGSAPLPEPSLDSMALAILELLDHARCTSAALCGVSLGGYAAVRAASIAPMRVSQLVLSAVAARFPAQAGLLAQRRDLIAAYGMEPVAERAVSMVFPDDKDGTSGVAGMTSRMAALSPEAYLENLAMLIDVDIAPYARRLKIPTCVVAAASDAGATQLAELMAEAHIHPFPEGHLAVLSRPADFADILMKLLISPCPCN